MIERAWSKPRADRVARTMSSARSRTGWAQVLEHHAVAEVVHVDVDPHPPLGGVHRERWPAARCSGVSACRNATGGIGDRSGVDLAAAERAQARCARTPSVVTPSSGRSSSAARSSTMARIGRRRLLDVRRAPTSTPAGGSRTAATRRRPARSVLRSGCSRSLASLARSARSAGHRRASASTCIDQRRVREHAGGGVESLAAPRVAKHAAGFGTIRLVAAKSQMPPSTMIDASSLPSATIAASRAKH